MKETFTSWFRAMAPGWGGVAGNRQLCSQSHSLPKPS
jgi:hypothetical protein